MERSVKRTKNIKRKKKLDDLVSSFESSVKECKELDEFFILATEENNSKLIQEITKNIELLKSQVQKNEIKCFLIKRK